MPALRRHEGLETRRLVTTPQVRHLRFIGGVTSDGEHFGVVYCPNDRKRVRVPGLVYGGPFTCPTCRIDVPPTSYYTRTHGVVT